MPGTIVLVMAIILVAVTMVLMTAQQLAMLRLLLRQDDRGRDDRSGGEGRGSHEKAGPAMFVVEETSATVASVPVDDRVPARPPLAVVRDGERVADAPALWRGARECTIMFVDIAGFGAARRSERDRRTLRDVTYTLVEDALDEVGAGPSVWYREDRGDGALLLLPDGVPAERLVARAVPAMLDGLRQHDRSAGPGLDLRLRVSLDAGRAAVDERGAFGDTVIAASRLLDAPLLKDRLTEPGRLLALILSARVHAALPETDAFERIDVHVKEHRLVGWTALYGADLDGAGGLDHRAVLPHRARRLIRAGRAAG
ncbi:hypothetical protein EBO15_05085 [Actinomadura harenae]|uniref:Guanylate cyclase domain-containing protein n=2 Tax=Actinomadura harenae TaxID=2483351 RepID=A0A3M2MB33_9ACTN|nr:hypothetical protein EBO15_05085 [Actinomadura harenae]